MHAQMHAQMLVGKHRQNAWWCMVDACSMDHAMVADPPHKFRNPSPAVNFMNFNIFMVNFHEDLFCVLILWGILQREKGECTRG